MTTRLHDLVIVTFSALEAKDLDKVMSAFADQAVLVDPHFPAPRMEGKTAIRDALRAAIAGMTSLGYTITNYFESANGQSAAVETATHHVLAHGMRRAFPQVFIIDTSDGYITRLQAYEPYGPHGMIGAFLLVARLKRRLLGR